MQKLAKIYFLLFGLLDLIALLTAFAYSLSYISEYFSYFTVLSNMLITFVFLSLALRAPSKKSIIQKLYAPAVLYMVITGIVFWTILHGGAGHLQRVPWVNMVLHGVTPIVGFTAWILFPPAIKLKYSDIWKWLVFPLVFVFYTLARGLFVNWYPYPILNPETAGGYVGVAKYAVGILLGAYILGVIFVFLRKLRSK